MNVGRLLWHQIRYDRLLVRRNPQASFFARALPVVLLVLFVSMFGNEMTDVGGREIRQSTYYVPAIVAFAVVNAAFVALLVGLVTQREMGILKRRQLTPEPGWIIVIGRAAGAVLSAFMMVAILVLVGWVAYDVEVPVETLPALVVTLALGAATFCCLAYAISIVVPSVDAALAVALGVTMPILFISGVFVPWASVPSGLQAVASVFPVRSLTRPVVHAFDPTASGPGFLAEDLAVLAAWGAFGLAVAWRWFDRLPYAERSAR